MKIIARALLIAGVVLVIFGLTPPPLLVENEETLFDSESLITPITYATQEPIALVPTRVVSSVVTSAVTSAAPLETPTPPAFFAPERPTPNIPTAASQTKEARQLTKLPAIPERLVISSIQLDTPILQATWRKVLYEGYVFDQYKAPKNAAGWHPNSALLGEVGNTVLNGHNNIDGEVFRYLDKVRVGDLIQVYSSDREYDYIVTNTMLLLEVGESSKKRMENAAWIGASNDERLTLVTCWPYVSNTHRLIIVAKPVSSSSSK